MALFNDENVTLTGLDFTRGEVESDVRASPSS